MIFKDMSMKLKRILGQDGIDSEPQLRKDVTSSRLNGMTTVDKAQEYRQRMAREADRAHAPIINALRRREPQAEIAARFDLSEQRISQIKQRAIQRGLLDSNGDGSH